MVFGVTPPFFREPIAMKAAEAVRLLAGAFAENGPPRRKLKDTVVGRVGNRVVDDVFCPEWSTLVNLQ